MESDCDTAGKILVLLDAKGIELIGTATQSAPPVATEAKGEHFFVS